MEMPQTYPLQWLDALVSVTLNPRKDFVRSITTEEIAIISENILKETLRLQAHLNTQFFILNTETEIRLLVQKYHSALIVLLDNAVDYKKEDLFKSSGFSEVMTVLVNSLDDLLSFIETRFSNYLSFDERVSAAYLSVSQKEIRLRLDQLKKKLIKEVDDKCITVIVLGSLYAFVNTNNSYEITYRELLYRKELIKELELLDEFPKMTSIYTTLDELLIFMNFNSIKYINHFIGSIVKKMNSFLNEGEKLDKLMFYFKEFNQLHSNENMAFNLKNQNLKIVISNWFIQEIAYLEKKLSQSTFPKQDSGKKENPPKENKITCLLSADQIGLILRAGDESRILNSKSMSEVFKTIIPHLSTPYKMDLSYHSVRSKSYNAEDKDKEIAIETLEKIIKKIKSY